MSFPTHSAPCFTWHLPTDSLVFCAPALLLLGLTPETAPRTMADFLDRLPEPMLDSGTAVAGCGGAFCNMFLEALADGGVACGLPRQKALLYAAQMVIGTAKLMLETGKHPGALDQRYLKSAQDLLHGEILAAVDGEVCTAVPQGGGAFPRALFPCPDGAQEALRWLLHGSQRLISSWFALG